VEDRPDAVNVNNWHWTERNAKQWSQDKLKELLLNFRFDTSIGSCKITEIERCEGDASANNRKGKIIIFYEWELRLKWKAKMKLEESEVVEGTVEIPNLSDENGVEDLDIQFLTDSKGITADLLKTILRAEGVSKVRDQLGKYLDALKTEFTQGMILPKKESSSSSVQQLSNLSIREQASKTTNTSSQESEKSPQPVKLSLCKLKSSANMKCTAEDLFNALIRPEMFAAFTNGSGRIDPKVGGTFEMFGGNVHGKILAIEAPHKLVQEWRLKSWPDGIFSKVTFTITQKEDESEVVVEQVGVPANEQEKTKEGWKLYYWESIKRTFGFGSMIA